MLIFNTDGSITLATIICGILSELGLDYDSTDTQNPPYLIVADHTNPRQFIGLHGDAAAARAFIKAAKNAKLYGGLEEIDTFVEAVSAFAVQGLPSARDEKVQAAKLAVAIGALGALMPQILGSAFGSPTGNPLAELFGPCTCAAPAPKPQPKAEPKPRVKKQAAGFDKTKASPLATKPVRVAGKVPLARNRK